ncbi:MAG: SDR family NAD(P)-dependent oxidoreductase [Rhizobiaceae bacterium]
MSTPLDGQTEALLARIDGPGWIAQAHLSTDQRPFALGRDAVSTAEGVHGLVNHSGIRTEISVEALPEDLKAAWRKKFQTNFIAAATLSKKVVRPFEQNGGGRLSSIASRGGAAPLFGNACPTAPQRQGSSPSCRRVKTCSSLVGRPQNSVSGKMH